MEWSGAPQPLSGQFYDGDAEKCQHEPVNRLAEYCVSAKPSLTRILSIQLPLTSSQPAGAGGITFLLDRRTVTVVQY